jgi:hypothetical protein
MSRTRTPDDSSFQASRIWTWRLWGLRDDRLDAVLTALALAALLFSRFLLLPSGPWEWDETLFARGILKFDLAAHFPHPPGFPLWMALGWLAHFLVSEPLRGLEILSAAASCAVLWPLSALGRRVAPPAVATATAVAILFAPGVWLHAGRGFSSTPAALLALWAAALAAYGLGGRRATAFTVLVTASFLVRPILLPSLGLLWLAGAASVRPRRRLAPGMLAGLAAVAVAVAVMVALQGSWTSFATPFLVHGRTHLHNLVENVGAFPDLGLVKGLGGVWLAVTLSVLTALGIAVWWRRVGRGAALAWLAILAVGISELVWLQNRTFPRYAVPFQMAAAPLVAAAAAAAAPPAVATATLLSLGVVMGTAAYAPVVEQHARLMPGWEALRFARDAATRTGDDIVVEPGLYPFLSYLEESDEARGRPWAPNVFLAPGSPNADAFPKGNYLVVTDFPSRYLVPTWGRPRRWDAVSSDLVPLTQGRFLDAAVIAGPPLAVSGWWFPETPGNGERFMWGEPEARLLLPPLPEGATLVLDLLPARGPAPLTVRVNGADVGLVPGNAPRTDLGVQGEILHANSRNEIIFLRREGYPPGRRDTRSLSVRLFPPRLLRSGAGAFGDLVSAAVRDGDLRRAALPPLSATGFYRPERFGSGQAAWAGPRASVRFPAVPGVVRLTLWAPRATPPSLRISVNGAARGGPLAVGQHPQPLSLVLTPADLRDGTVELTLESEPFVPASTGKSADRRTLGVVVSRIALEPSGTGCACGWLALPSEDKDHWVRLLAAPVPSLPEAAGFGWDACGEGGQLEGGPGSWLLLGRQPKGTALLAELNLGRHGDSIIVRANGAPVAVIPPGVRHAAVAIDAGALHPDGLNRLDFDEGSEPHRDGSPGTATLRLRDLARVGPRVPWVGRIDTPEARAAVGVSIDGAATPRSSPAAARGFYRPQEGPSGPAIWTSPEAELDLPPTPGVLTLTLSAPRPTPANLRIFLDGKLIAGPLEPGSAGRHIAITLPTAPAADLRRLVLRATPYRPAQAARGQDSRPLGVLLGGVELTPFRAGDDHWRIVPSPEAGGLVLQLLPPGVYGQEHLGPDEGAWIVPRAVLRAPIGPGTLTLTAWAARPTPPRLEVWLGDQRLAGPWDVPNSPTAFEVHLPRNADFARPLELRSVPFTPGGGDPRSLGVLVQEVAFTPAGS